MNYVFTKMAIKNRSGNVSASMPNNVLRKFMYIFWKCIHSQVRNFQKLKNISLKAVNFLATKTKVTCLSKTDFFHLHIPELPQFSRPYG